MKKIVIIGNVGREPQVRTTKSGKNFTEFSVAVNDKEDTCLWVSVILNRESKVTDYLKKGKHVYVEGNFVLDVYKNEPTITVYANELQLLGSAKDSSNSDVVDRNPDIY